MQTSKNRKTPSTLWIGVVAICLVLTAAAWDASAKEVTYEGTIQGLNCTYYDKKCPKEDIDIYAALEDDFVLVLPDGKFFMLPNLSMRIKARHLTETVRIRGERNGTSIWVENLEVKENGAYQTVWNRKRQEAKRTAP
jgi:hypothetical protein